MFFFRHVELNTRFNVMTINEVTLNRPEVFPGFSVIFCFCRLKPFRFALKFSTEIFTSLQVVPTFGFSDSVVSSKQVCCSICDWEYKNILCGVDTSFALSLRAWISDASRFSISSMPAITMSPFQIPLSPRSTHNRGIFHVKLSYQNGGASTGLLKKSDDIQPLHQTE